MKNRLLVWLIRLGAAIGIGGIGYNIVLATIKLLQDR